MKGETLHRMSYHTHDSDQFAARLFIVIIPPVLMLLLAVVWHATDSLAQTQQTLPAACSETGLEGEYNQNVNLSGDVYVTGDVTLISETHTISPGTNLYFCGPYSVRISHNGFPGNPAGSLRAIGTQTEPITFVGATEAITWGTISYGASFPEPPGSLTMHHVTLRNGGGTDPAADTGTIRFSGSSDAPDLNLNHVTIENSTTYGIWQSTDQSDDTPGVMENLTITGSGKAPIVSTNVGGLGTGNTFENNGVNEIEFRTDTSNANEIRYTQTWYSQPVPYHIVQQFDGMQIGNDFGPQIVWTIEASTTLLIDPGIRFTTIGSSGIVAEGTPDRRITLTRYDENSNPWAGIGLSTFSRSSLEYIDLLHTDPGSNIDDAVVDIGGSAPAHLNHVRIRNTSGTGVATIFTPVSMTDSEISFARDGVYIDRAQVTLRRNVFENISDTAVTERNDRGSQCVDAVGNYWGSPTGPADDFGESDLCGAGGTNAGDGGAVSRNVRYTPWLTTPDGSTPTNLSSIVPERIWAISGQDETELLVTVRDAEGTPLEGKEVTLQTSRGTVTQPATPTDANGRTTATITSDSNGEAVISGQNVTDGEPLAGTAGMRFWDGGGDTGGLIDLDGPPYNYPNLEVEGEPFQVGFPVIFRLPMRNTNPDPLEVSVEYSVSNFGIGAGFTTVTSLTEVLDAGEAWDAPGGFTPPSSAHRCVRFDLTYGPEAASIQQSGSTSGQRNLKNASPSPPPPCERADATKMIPTSFGLQGVYKHSGNMAKQTRNVNDCLNTEVDFLALQQNDRDYTTLVITPTLTPQPLVAGGDVTPAQADAASTLADTAAELTALNLATIETRARLDAASEAESWDDAARQLDAYRNFQRQRADRLDAFATEIDDLVAAIEGTTAATITITPADYQAYLADLQASGYDSETRQFLSGLGLDAATIDAMQAFEIDVLEQGDFETISFVTYLRQMQEDFRQEAAQLREYYETEPQLAADGTTSTAPPSAITFEVGNPFDSASTIDLFVRPVSLPYNWSYELDQQSVELESGESVTVTLTLDPGGSPVVTDEDVQMTVEGYAGTTLVGGVQINQRIPTVGGSDPGNGTCGAQSSFDSDDEGWRVLGEAHGDSAVPTYQSTGGNPGGYIEVVDNATGSTWYWDAPEHYLGDQSCAYSGTLRFDLRQSSTDNQFDDDDIVLEGGGLTLVYNTAENPGTDWTSYSIPLNETAGWSNAATAEPATQQEMQAVLTDLTALRIRGEFVDGADVGGLDNVSLSADIPDNPSEPGTGPNNIYLPFARR